MGKLSDLLDAPPPPAYERLIQHGGGRLHQRHMPGGLDASLWLAILGHLIDPKRRTPEQQAFGWSDLHRNVRFVCRDLYLVCMHLLRSHHLPRYLQRIRAPYTSDPYPAGQAIPQPLEPTLHRAPLAQGSSFAGPSSSSMTSTRGGSGAGRETRILDLYIAAAVRSDVEAYESSLLESTLGDEEEGENDLFAYHQPKCRIEDLVIALGRRRGVIQPDSLANSFNDGGYDVKAPSYEASQASMTARPRMRIQAHDLAIELRSKTAILRVRSDQSASRALRTMLEVPRGRDEVLEATASRIVEAMVRL